MEFEMGTTKQSAGGQPCVPASTPDTLTPKDAAAEAASSAASARSATALVHDPASSLPALPLRRGDITVSALVELYMAHYAGRDTTRTQRLGWWTRQLGDIALQDVSDDHLHVALEALASHSGRYFAGSDADGKPIFRAKKKPMAPATINRYAASIAAVFTWAIRRRIAPKGWDHPGRRIERRTEANEKTRFLSTEERDRLLAACRACSW